MKNGRKNLPLTIGLFENKRILRDHAIEGRIALAPNIKNNSALFEFPV